LQLGTLGKYQLIKRIAAGGMAEIYLAKASGLPGFEKLVVVKRILPQLSAERDFIEMFLDEARIAATLQHPNIVQMFDIGAVEGNYFIAMEYLHGEDLRTLMRTVRRRKEILSLDHALNIVIGVAAGLHYAHDKAGFDGKPLGIVHRDVKPHNVIITYDGGIKVVDFGIAKASNRLNETRYGTLKGKIPYMSPEQCQAQDIDRRSDIYAIGIMLYELTTGARLYSGGSDFEIMKQIVDRPVIPPLARRPNYPRDLEPIVLRALAKKPADRYATAQELQAELEAYAREKRLVVSSIALSAYLQQLFGERINAWRRASTDEERVAARFVSPHGNGADPKATTETAVVKDDSHEAGERARAEGLEPSRGAAGEYDHLGDETTGVTVTSGSGRGSTPTGIGEIEVRFDTGLTPAWRRRWIGAAAATAIAALAGVSWLAMREPGGTTRPAGPAAQAAAASGPSRSLAAAAAARALPPAPTSPAAVDHLPTVDPLPEETSAAPDTSSAAAPAVSVATLSVGEVDRAPAGRRAADTPARKARPAAAAPGELRIACQPSCEVIVDGTVRGSTPLAGIELPAGPHKVHLVSSRFGIDLKYTVTIEPGQITKKKHVFPVTP
jgi:serine/threonine protein kinase